MPKKDRGLSLAEIEQETKKLAADLAFFAKGPVSIQLVGGKHIAFTYNTHQKDRTIPIVMNPSKIADVRHKERAIAIWRGIGYHELAHHLWPADEQYKVAGEEGFRDLFNLVDDEQNERRGRAFHPVWGACFQTVCAFIFPTKGRDLKTISVGIVDGGKTEKKPRGVAAHEIYARRWNLFAYHFRRHVPGCADDVVSKALALIPQGFKDLSKEELLELTRQIHLILSSDIKINEEEEKAAAKKAEAEERKEKEKAKQEEKKTGGEDNDPEDDPDSPAPDESLGEGGWGLRGLLRSKWLYVAFAAFILLWSVLMIGSASVSFWFKSAIFALLMAAVVVFYLWRRRAFIKALAQRLRGVLPALPASAADGGASDKRLGVVTGFSIVALGVFIGLACRILGLKLDQTLLVLAGSAVLLTISTGLYKARNSRRRMGDLENRSIKLLLVAICLSSVTLISIMYYMGFGGQILAGSGGGLALLALLLLVVMKASQPQKDGGRETLGGRAKRLWKSFWRAIGGWLYRRFAWLARKALDAIIFVAGSIWSFIVMVAGYLWHHIVVFSMFTARCARRAYWTVEPTLLKIWANPFVRLLILAAPLAILVAMLYAVAYTAAQVSWWLLVVLLLALLLLLFLLWWFRKQIKKFIAAEVFVPMPRLMVADMRVPLNMDDEWFNQIHDVQPVEKDQALIDAMLPEVYPLAQQLRQYLVRCGRQRVDLDDQPEGYDLTEEAELALVGETSIFVDDDSQIRTSVHIEVALDCSSSMNSRTATLQPGEKFAMGKFFGLVIEQAVLNLPGVSARFWGFTDRVIYDCGEPGEGGMSGLVCAGGNNDAAMLWHMSQSAAKSGKDVKILLMLSDGQPSECSWRSLHSLVLQLEQEGNIPWNFGLDNIHVPAFERFFTDLVGQTKEEALITMGETLATLAQDGI